MNNFLRFSNLKHLLTFLGPNPAGEISEGPLTFVGNIGKKISINSIYDFSLIIIIVDILLAGS